MILSGQVPRVSVLRAVLYFSPQTFGYYSKCCSAISQ